MSGKRYNVAVCGGGESLHFLEKSSEKGLVWEPQYLAYLLYGTRLIEQEYHCLKHYSDIDPFLGAFSACLAHHSA